MTEERHVSALALEAFLRGDAGAADTEHVEGCPVCLDRVARRRTHDAAFLSRFADPPALANAARVPQPMIGRRVAIALALAASVAAIAILPDRGPTPALSERIKGDGEVSLLVEREGAYRPWSGEALKPGDVLMFRYSGPRRSLVVLSVEDSGDVQVLSGDRVVTLGPGQNVVAPVGVELDDHVGAELIIALVGVEAFSVKDALVEVRRRARTLKPGTTPKTILRRPIIRGVKQQSWTISKEPP